MSQGIQKAAAGMMAGMDRFGTIANNLANVSTTGYKRDLQFLRLLTREQTSLERRRSGGAPVQELVQDQFTDFSQGELNETGNRLDLAISGEGLFTVQTTEGIAYTRNGSFTLDKNYFLVDYLGNPIMGEGGEISITGADVIINRFGEVEVDGKNVGKIKIVVFEDDTKLRKAGNSLFYPLNEKVKPQLPTKSYLISQGYLESSNVNLVQEMINMIVLSKEFEANQKIFQTHDELMRQEAREIGKVR